MVNWNRLFLSVTIRAPVDALDDAVDFRQLFINLSLNDGELASIDLDDAAPRARNLGVGLEQADLLFGRMLAFGTLDRD